MAFQNEEQITKYQNNKVVLEFNDHMYPAPVEQAANLHAGYSKIYIVAIDTSKGGGSNAKVIDVNVDPVKIKRLFEKVSKIPEAWQLAGESAADTGVQENQIGMGAYAKQTPSEVLLEHGDKGVAELEKLIPIFEKNADKYAINKTKIKEIKAAIENYKKGTLKPKAVEHNAPASKILLSEKKILGNDNNKNPQNAEEYKVTLLTIEYNPKMKSCWTVYLENGWGQKELNPNGGYSIKKNTYRKEKDVKIFIDDEKFRDMMLECKDYITFKESKFFMALDDQMIKFREEKRKKAMAANAQ